MDGDLTQRASLRQQKEAFVSGTNGTSSAEVDAVLSSPLLLLLVYGFLFHLTTASSGTSAKASGPALSYYFQCVAAEFAALVVPLCLLVTVAADAMAEALSALAALALLLLVCNVYQKKPTVDSLSSSLKSPCRRDVGEHFLTDYRAYMYLATAICILAVDFPVFPRRFAKAETYGKGLMDIGVGSFVISGAAVSKPARGWSAVAASDSRSWVGEMLRASKTSLVLLALGVARMVTTSKADYQTHVTEYGVHWNFFVTLAVVRILSTAILSVGPKVNISICFSVSAVVHQVLLEAGLAVFVSREGERDVAGFYGLLAANREGVVSILGYVALHLVGVQIGRVLFSSGCLQRNSNSDTTRRMSLMDYGMLLMRLCCGSMLAMVVCVVCEAYVEPVSRRTANLPYIMWMIHTNLLSMAVMLLANMVLEVTQCVRYTGKNAAAPGEQAPDRALRNAINGNGLSFFLVANVLTGLVNLTLDTMTAGTITATLILCAYLLLACLPVVVMHSQGIRLM